MKFTTLFAAAALATASTAAIADQADVTTDAGELVMIEKNVAMNSAIVPIVIGGVIMMIAAGGGS